MKLKNYLLLIFLLANLTVFGQESKNTYSVKGWWHATPDKFSPVVNSDNTITFRLKAPEAKEVSLYFGEWFVQPQAMYKNSDDIWSITIGPVEPQIYAYNFSVDGLMKLDPKNPEVKIGTEIYSSIVEVNAVEPRFDQVRNIDYGVVSIHRYFSKTLQMQRGVYVYVPTEYAKNPKKKYPAFYLRHGGGDNEASWSGISGRADVILENLISEGKAKPMIVVMTNGLTDGTWAGGSSPEGMALLEKELFEDVLPLVESNYRVLSGKKNTAIGGLSMGGGQSFVIGLRNPDKFSWVGDFSSGLLSATEFNPEEYIPDFNSNIDEINKNFSLVWLACGTDDPRIEGHRELSAKLRKQGLNHMYDEIPGGHEWTVWRIELYKFMQQLF